jgi:hypothetical protein
MENKFDKIEAMRLQDSFSDGIRGLVNYGVKTLQPEGVAVLNYENSNCLVNKYRVGGSFLPLLYY